jgi:hypothetical protein
MPIRVEPAPPPAERERGALSAAIGVLKLATDEAARASEPVARLESAVRAATAADAALKGRREEHQRQLGDWIARGCPDGRPEPPPELIEAERNYALTLADAEAARATLAPLTATLSGANDRVRAASAQRASAVYRAAAAIAFVRAEELRRRLDHALLIEAELNSLTDALTLAHNKGDHEALIAANEVRAAIMGAKKAAAVPHVPRVGSALLARLMVDSQADFEEVE